jgi:copper chaperone
METLEFKVQNIKCGGCASTIETTLNDIAGIDKVNVDISSGMVSVEHNETSMDSISQKLTEIGFPLAS